MKAILIILSATLAWGCDYDVTKGGESGAPSRLAADAPLDFTTVMEFSIRPVCLECHAAPRNASGVNLETYATVFANRGAVADALSSRFMPDSVGRSMSGEQRELVLKWIEAGAPQEETP